MRSSRINFSQVFRLNEADIKRTSCGFIKLPVRVSRIGVMAYKDSAGKSYNEFKPPEELFNENAMATLQDVPVTDKHPEEVFVRPYNWKKLAVGFVPGKPEIDQDYYLSSELVISDQNMIDAVCRKFKSGQDQQVSAGYSANIIEEKGEWNGEPYDSVQRDIQFNHCALVDVGRAGSDVKLIWPEDKKDSKPVLNSPESKSFRYASIFI